MRQLMVALVVALCVGCSSEQPADQPESAETRRTRDSVIGESKLPGAGGVRGALDAADSAAARRSRLDSLSGTP